MNKYRKDSQVKRIVLGNATKEENRVGSSWNEWKPLLVSHDWTELLLLLPGVRGGLGRPNCDFCRHHN